MADPATLDPETDVAVAEQARPDDRIDDDRMDEENTLKPQFVAAVTDALEDGDVADLDALIEPLHPADLADLLELLQKDQRTRLAAFVPELMTGEVVAELNDFVREDMMEALAPGAVATIVEQLETDDAVQLIEDLDEDDQRAVLAEVEPVDRIAIESALAYPEETAGRLMDRDFVAVPEHLTVGGLIDILRDSSDLPDEFYEVFVVDELHRPVGTCALSWIMRAPRTVKLSDVMKRDQTLIPVQRAVLAEVQPNERVAIESALAYPDETAGRLMDRDFVAVPEHLTVGNLIDILREDSDLPDEFYEVFIVDEKHRPVGTCALSWILRAPRSIALSDVMKRDQTLIPVQLDQEEVGLMFQKYNLISAAVVDEAGRLVGQMTVDDIVHIIAEEAGEDALLMSGAGDGDINEPLREAYSARVRWLIANLGTALVASAIIYFFGAAIEKLVALAVLMPIVASIGGNAGTQTMAVTVRAIAMNQLTRSNTRRILWRELRVAMLNGVTIAVLIGLATGAIFTPLLGGVIAAAMVVNVLVAGLAGVLVPVIFDRLNTDPAVASSVFVTMITDSMGFFAFLGLAVISGVV